MVRFFSISVFCIILTSCFHSSNNSSGSNPFKEDSIVSITSLDFLKEFNKDAVIAHSKFKGKRILINHLLLEEIGETSEHERSIGCRPVDLDKNIIYSEFGGDIFYLGSRVLKPYTQSFIFLGTLKDPEQTSNLSPMDRTTYKALISVEGDYVDYTKGYCELCATIGILNGGSLTSFVIELRNCKIVSETF